MNHSAHPPGALEGDTVSLGVQAGSRFQFAENTGAFNDCGGVRIGGARSRRPQSPMSTLIAVLTVPAIVVAVGLVWSQL
jgi:hypothetical protein